MVIGLIVQILQTTIQPWMIPWGHGPDLSIILVVYLGLKAPLTSGAVLVTALGFLKDGGGGIMGVNPGIFLLVFLAAALARQRLDPNAPWHLMMFILAFSVVAGVLAWGSFYLLGGTVDSISFSWFSPAVVYLVSALTTALLGPPLFHLLDLLRPKIEPQPEREA